MNVITYQFDTFEKGVRGMTWKVFSPVGTTKPNTNNYDLCS